MTHDHPDPRYGDLWSGRVQERTEVIGPEQSEALAGLLGVEPPTDLLPELWHWTHLTERRPQADLGPDGHPTTGIPAPPGPGRKRMFAGGRVIHHALLRIGQPATRMSEVVTTQEKQGRVGPLTFVTVRHTISQDNEVRIVDEQDIVYLTSSSTLPTRAGTLDSPPAPTDRSPIIDLRVDEAMLFRFSALTYNAHRIHYDLSWTQQEGYSGLVIHGPLQALMMGELFRRYGDGLVARAYGYRLVAPMVGPQTLRVIPGPDGLDHGAEVLDVHGVTTATATVAPAGRTV